MKAVEEFIDRIVEGLKMMKEEGLEMRIKATGVAYKEYLKDEIKRNGGPELSDDELIFILALSLPESLRDDLIGRVDPFKRERKAFIELSKF
jgi:hypothetical protein